MKKYTPDYESGLMEIDDKYGEYVLASEHEDTVARQNAEIAELRKEITLLKVERDNANQHNSIMRLEIQRLLMG